MKPEQEIVQTAQADSQVEKPMQKSSPLVMWQVGKIKNMTREFDVAFWQAQDTSSRLNAGWELVAYYLKRKGRTDELRLQRTVESIQRTSR